MYRFVSRYFLVSGLTVTRAGAAGCSDDPLRGGPTDEGLSAAHDGVIPLAGAGYRPYATRPQEMMRPGSDVAA
jgi:hypothetical protein